MSTTALPNDLIGLALVVLLLGIRHGFDPDHLAAIDAMTRYNMQTRPRLARLAGVWFALGHGLVLIGVALGVSMAAGPWRLPTWLGSAGAWLSAALLTALALLNIASALGAPADQDAPLRGWRSSVLRSLLRVASAPTMMGVGAVFALSLDTLSQASLFAVAAAQHGGVQPALLLAMLFTLGMLITDGVNGWCVARLVRRSNHAARIASRAMALAVAGVSLLVAVLIVAGETTGGVDAWLEGKELWLAAAICTVMIASYLAGQRLARAAGTART